MAFKIANVSGKAALVKGEHYYDLKTISNNVFDDDTLNALSNTPELDALYLTLDDLDPTGQIKDAILDAPISSPKTVMQWALIIEITQKKLEWKFLKSL